MLKPYNAMAFGTVTSSVFTCLLGSPQSTLESVTEAGARQCIDLRAENNSGLTPRLNRRPMASHRTTTPRERESWSSGASQPNRRMSAEKAPASNEAGGFARTSRLICVVAADLDMIGATPVSQSQLPATMADKPDLVAVPTVVTMTVTTVMAMTVTTVVTMTV